VLTSALTLVVDHLLSVGSSVVLPAFCARIDERSRKG
jgi:hypothetical protein